MARNINEIVRELRSSEINTTELIRSNTANQTRTWKEEAGSHFDEMLKGPQATLSYFHHSDSKVRKVAISMFASYWPADRNAERMCLDCISSSEDETIKVTAIVTLSFIRNQLYTEPVSLNLAHFIFDASLSIALRNKLYKMLILSFGTLPEKLDIIRSGPESAKEELQVAMDVVERCVKNDYTTKRMVLTVLQEAALRIYLESKALCAAAQYFKAVEKLSDAIRLWPDVTGPYVARAKAYEHLGNFESAIGDYSRAIELAPNTGHLYLSRANVYRLMGNDVKADEDLRRLDRITGGE